MINQSRGHPTMKMNNASTQPLFEDWDMYAKWLRQLDITVYDYPYMESIILNGYVEWLSQITELPELSEARFFVANHQGELIATDPNEPNEMPEVGESELLVETVLNCILRLDAIAIPFPGGSYVAVPVFTRTKGELFAVLGCRIQGCDHKAALLLMRTTILHFRTCFYKNYESIFISDLLLLQQQAKREEHRRSMLFEVVQKLHDKIDVDSVLTEIFELVSGMYPAAKLELLMSQDHLSRDPRVKSLHLQGNEEHICVRAFMEDRVLHRVQPDMEGEAYLELAAPLSGKQGVYGIFHFVILRDLIDDVDFQLIGMLADTAGTAFENAKLYEQSNLLISELRLINELAKRLNQSLRLKDVFQFATEELLSIFKAEYCSISQINKESDSFEIMSCNVPGLSKETFPKDYGFSGLVYSTKEPMILSDYKAHGKVPSRLMDDTNSRSLIAAPLIVRGEVNGAIMLTHRQIRFFSYENYKLLQVLASHIGLAIANASLHAEVRRMANRDMLTGLYARHYVDDAIQEFQKKDVNGSLIIVDIDLFKQVNDTYGHQTGDKILKQVCAIVRSSIRKTDIAARWGGEELAVYLPGADADNAYQIAETIRLRVAMDTDPTVTVSCGIADWVLGDDKVSVETLFYEADMALYKAKNNGRNQTQIAERCKRT
ncbi:diguanylate cyclase [Paenibacillus puldeungensis]|uniref:Diguanylate cyclase n=1 Tax=Paenibacillus puldeungensis TaxID=696536 RepID=A0ABW3RVJ3_9BACL